MKIEYFRKAIDKILSLWLDNSWSDIEAAMHQLQVMNQFAETEDEEEFVNWVKQTYEIE